MIDGNYLREEFGRYLAEHKATRWGMDAAQRDHIGDGPDHEDGPDADGFSGPRPWNSYGNAPQSVELPEPDTSDIAGYTPHALRTYGDAREAAGYARGLADGQGHCRRLTETDKAQAEAALRGEVK